MKFNYNFVYFFCINKTFISIRWSKKTKIFELIEQINQTFLILLLFPVFIPYINEKYKMPDLLNHDHHLISDATENLPTSIHKKNKPKKTRKNTWLWLWNVPVMPARSPIWIDAHQRLDYTNHHQKNRHHLALKHKNYKKKSLLTKK